MYEMKRNGIVKFVDKNDKNFFERDSFEDVYCVSRDIPEIFIKCSPAEYIVIEPEISEKEKKVYDFLINIIKLSNDNEFLKDLNKKEYVKRSIEKILNLYSVNISDSERQKIEYFILRNLIGLGKIQPLLDDPNIEDISCNGYDIPLYIQHGKYGSLKTNVYFDKEELDSLIRRMAQISGKMINFSNPMVDATLPDGSRIQITLGSEVTTKGSTFTIRKFREKPFLPIDLVKSDMFSPEMMAYLRLAVEEGLNIMFAGETASGKTTAVNAICYFIPILKKIVSIEDTRELNLVHKNWIPGVSRNAGISESAEAYDSGKTRHGTEISLYDLLRAAMRQRPDYIIVGEIRGREAYVLFQAMATGHATISTIHAESIENLIHRLENPPLNVPRSMIQTLDILVILEEVKENEKEFRKCTSIHEIIKTDPNTKEIITNDIFKMLPENKQIISENSYVFNKIKTKRGWDDEKMKSVYERYTKGFM
ncbi:MAG: type II/IV secretion system ATPase subunit [Methanosarcinaceae archaeon]|nr:type II/IV secretion system ATPase subunit [Methanosarcinaceae archaeon]